jgi:hypothetical protein
MKFNTVKIQPDSVNRDEWVVSFSESDCDRANEDRGPHSMGFYHYPHHMDKEIAFKVLCAHLVDKHEMKIAMLTKSLEKLHTLKIPNWAKVTK